MLFLSEPYSAYACFEYSSITFYMLVRPFTNSLYENTTLWYHTFFTLWLSGRVIDFISRSPVVSLFVCLFVLI